MKLLFIALACLAAENLPSASPVHEVDIKPAEIIYKGPHRAYWNSAHSNARLLISLGGTNSTPAEFEAFDRDAAEHGFHVMAIDYSNSVITTICRDLGQRGCFERFHRAIALGEPVSAQVHVPAGQSIVDRVRSLLKNLASRDSQWSKFWRNGDVDWQHTWIVGHSQGSGHAAYLSKRFAFERVILIAGPQDAFADGRVDDWVAVPGKTNPSAYWAILHQKDFFKSELQTKVFHALGGKELILNKDQVSDPHNHLLTVAYRNEWDRLLSAP